jgi:ubiquinone/menaquinone biosynthesis C-methylase UbiE
MSLIKKFNFESMAFVHDTLYSIFRDPHKVLNSAGIRQGQRVLEVGCGPGFFTVPAARMVGEKGNVVALDINPLAIERVQRKIAKENVKNVKTMVVDAAETGLPAKSFDLIFLFGFSHNRGNMTKIWVELHRLLKTEGILAVEGRPQHPTELFEIIKQNDRIKQFRKV